MRIGISTAIALAIIAPPLAAEQPATLPNWMAGAWIQTEGDAWAEEFWTPARGGMMIGTGRNGRGAKLTGWEMMRIEQDGEGRIAFLGSPEGAPPTRFPLVSGNAQEIVFANPAHDYPQRIRYWRDGKLLHAEISLADGGKPVRWSYRPMGE
jgi:hypothetical protein